MKHNKYPKLFEKGYIGNLKVKKMDRRTKKTIKIKFFF